jgi:hypothetical protein
MESNENVTRLWDPDMGDYPTLYKLSVLERLYVEWGFKVVIDVDEGTGTIVRVDTTRPDPEDVVLKDDSSLGTVGMIIDVIDKIRGYQVDHPAVDSMLRVADGLLAYRNSFAATPTLPKTGRAAIDGDGTASRDDRRWQEEIFHIDPTQGNVQKVRLKYLPVPGTVGILEEDEDALEVLDVNDVTGEVSVRVTSFITTFILVYKRRQWRRVAMKKTIRGYKLDYDKNTTVSVPKGARVLSLVVTKFDGPRLYMLVDSDNETEDRTFTAVKAYVPFDYKHSYLGTAVVHTGLHDERVYHFFEVDPDQTKLENVDDEKEQLRLGGFSSPSDLPELQTHHDAMKEGRQKILTSSNIHHPTEGPELEDGLQVCSGSGYHEAGHPPRRIPVLSDGIVVGHVWYCPQCKLKWLED